MHVHLHDNTRSRTVSGSVSTLVPHGKARLQCHWQRSTTRERRSQGDGSLQRGGRPPATACAGSPGICVIAVPTTCPQGARLAAWLCLAWPSAPWMQPPQGARVPTLGSSGNPAMISDQLLAEYAEQIRIHANHPLTGKCPECRVRNCSWYMAAVQHTSPLTYSDTQYPLPSRHVVQEETAAPRAGPSGPDQLVPPGEG